LNLILGPNGTGKSALVCGIIIGLAGDASTTGRSGSLMEYIKFGCLYALIQIELFNPNGDNYTIERKLVAFENKCRSEWKLNGRSTSQAEVRQFICSLSINVSNLCQFLPQERVVEFARMNSKQLLENTQKAVGDEEMFKDYEELLRLSNKLQDLQAKHSSLHEQLVTQEILNERMAEQAQRIREMEEYKDKVDWLQKKKPWIEFEQIRVAYIKVKEEVENLEKLLKKKTSQNVPLMKAVDNAKVKLNGCEKEYKQLIQNVKQKTIQLDTCTKEVEKISDQSANILTEFEAKKQMEEERKQQIIQMKEDMKALSEKMNALSEIDLNPQIDSVNQEISLTGDKIKQLSKDIQQVTDAKDILNQEMRNINSKLVQINDVFKKRMDLLGRMDKRAHDATKWLEQNKSRFKHKIYFPIMTQINVKTKEGVGLTENSIPVRDLLAFVGEDLQDIKLFSSLLKKELNISVNIVQAPNVQDYEITPTIPMSRLKAFGFTNFVVDLFDAPKPILRYLCKNHNLHNIPIGGQQINSSSVLESKLNINKFYCGNIMYQSSISRYDRENLVITSKLKEPKCLYLILDVQKKQELEQQLFKTQEKMQSVCEDGQAIEKNKCEEEKILVFLRTKRKDLIQKRDEKKILETKIRQKKEAISRKEKERIDISEEWQKVVLSWKRLNDNKLTKIDSMVEFLEKCVECDASKLVSSFNSFIAKAKLDNAERAFRQTNAKYAHIEMELKKLKEEKDRLRKEAKHKQLIAQKTINCHENQLPKEIIKKFRPLPDNIEEVDAEIRNLVIRMESMDNNCDASVLKEFDIQNVAIEKRKKEIEELRADIHIISSNLELIKKRWLSPLQELVSNINNNFSRFMARLECAGEVLLSNDPENTVNDAPNSNFDFFKNNLFIFQNDFEKYGINIKVKYRDNEQLKELSAFHQSGGERSVATMIYMIALQELTKVPFRCVDEINQGMDDTNERRVFDLIVETASHNLSQYFLLSPKLLSGLKFTDRMHIHVIFNGPHLALDWNEIKLVD